MTVAGVRTEKRRRLARRLFQVLPFVLPLLAVPASRLYEAYVLPRVPDQTYPEIYTDRCRRAWEMYGEKSNLGRRVERASGNEEELAQLTTELEEYLGRVPQVFGAESGMMVHTMRLLAKVYEARGQQEKARGLSAEADRLEDLIFRQFMEWMWAPGRRRR